MSRKADGEIRGGGTAIFVSNDHVDLTFCHLPDLILWDKATKIMWIPVL